MKFRRYCAPRCASHPSSTYWMFRRRPHTPPDWFTWFRTASIANRTSRRKEAPIPESTTVVAIWMPVELTPWSVEPPFCPGAHWRPEDAFRWAPPFGDRAACRPPTAGTDPEVPPCVRFDVPEVELSLEVGLLPPDPPVMTGARGPAASVRRTCGAISTAENAPTRPPSTKTATIL